MHCRFVAAGILAFLSVSGAAMAGECPGNPDALGTSRVLTIDPAEYKRIGTVNYKNTLPLEDHEVVLTFDDGPIPPHTNEVLDTLKSECVKATFFIVGEMARAHPELVRRAYNEGHTIGTHTDHHPFMHRLTPDKVEKEIADAILSTGQALGGTEHVAPFFRVPYLDITSTAEERAFKMGLSIWSIDFHASDWTFITSDKVASLAIARIEAKKKGILLLHDIHDRTAKALPVILRELKKRGYKIVHVVPSSGAVAKIEEKPETKTAEASPTVKPAVLVPGAEQKSAAKTEEAPAVATKRKQERVEKAEKKDSENRRRYASRAERKKTSESWHTNVKSDETAKSKRNAFDNFFDALWGGGKREHKERDD